MKKCIFLVLIFAFAVSLLAQTPQPGIMPRWDRLVDWIKNGQFTMTYKTLTAPTIGGTVTYTSPIFNATSTTGSARFKFLDPIYVAGDNDTIKIDPYKALYVIEFELNNGQLFAVDSAGIIYGSSGETISNVTNNYWILTSANVKQALDATYSWTSTVATASGGVTFNNSAAGSTERFFIQDPVYVATDGDTIRIDPYKSLYAIELEMGNTQKFAVDSTGVIYGSNAETFDNLTNDYWQFTAANLKQALSANIYWTSTVAAASGGVTFNQSSAGNTERFFVLDPVYIAGDGDSLKFDAYKGLYPIEFELANTQKFAVDSTGVIYGPSGETISNVSNDYWDLTAANIKHSLDATHYFNTTVATASGGVTFNQSANGGTERFYFQDPILVTNDGDSIRLDAYKSLYAIEFELADAQKFAVDSTGVIYGANGETLDNTTNDYWQMSAANLKQTLSAGIYWTSTVAAASGGVTFNQSSVGNTERFFVLDPIYIGGDGDSLKFDAYKGLYPIEFELANTQKFAVDSTGIIYGPNGGTLSNVTDTAWILGENSENLLFTFTNDAVTLSSTTALATLDVGAIALKVGTKSMTNLDVMSTSGNVKRWGKITIDGQIFWAPSDTAYVK